MLGILLVLGFIWDLILVGRAYNLDKGEWASWVQAVGSILAIMVAFWIAYHQLQHSRRLEKERAISEDRRRVEIIQAILISAWILAYSLKTAITSNDTEFLANFNWKSLQDLADSFRSVRTIEVPDVTIVITLTPVPTALEMVASPFRHHGMADRYESGGSIMRDLKSAVEDLLDATNNAKSSCANVLQHLENQ